MSEQPGRYQRSFSGLIGAMIATLLAIGAFVAFRAVTRADIEGGPEPIDYLAQVGYAQDAGVEVVYPASLPEDWIATSVELDQGDRPGWGIGLLTDAGDFVGVRQDADSLEALLEEYVDESAVDELTGARVESELGSRWRVFEDDGGDLAYGIVDGERTVLVYGSASEADLELVVGQLTTEPR